LGAKNQWPVTLNWQSTNPATNFLPQNQKTQNGSVPSGVTSGAMASTNLIYSQIMDVSRADAVGISLTFSGTPTGVIQIMVANLDAVFYALTFNPGLSQPAGAAGGFYVNLSEIGFKFVMVEYTNTSGTGTLTGTVQMKDWN
jgi:hypothetical protein